MSGQKDGTEAAAKMDFVAVEEADAKVTACMVTIVHR
jgi:hypothetical protein